MHNRHNSRDATTQFCHFERKACLDKSNTLIMGQPFHLNEHLRLTQSPHIDCSRAILPFPCDERLRHIHTNLISPVGQSQ